MTPFSLLLVLGGWVLVWTGIKGDGRGGYNPLYVIADAAAGRRVSTNSTSGGSTGGSSSGGAGSTQGGGLILHPGNDPKGHGTHLHFEHPNGAVVIAIGLYCKGRGFDVAEHPMFGGVSGNCTCDPHCGQAHCENRAIDVNWRMGGDERTKLIELADDIAKRVKSVGSEVAAA